MRGDTREHGQAMVEFGIIGVALMMLSVGLIDVGRGFLAYNSVSVAARYAARWGSVVGGTCSAGGGSGNDWCNQIGASVSGTCYSGQTIYDFWNTPGNCPLQGNNACPDTIISGPFPNAQYNHPNPYYTVSPTYNTSTSTTIVGAVAQKFDTTSSSNNIIVGGVAPGFDLSKLEVCIQFPSEAYSSASMSARMGGGYIVTVYVYYPFQPVSGLFGNVTLNLVSSSQYQVEGT